MSTTPSKTTPPSTAALAKKPAAAPASVRDAPTREQPAVTRPGNKTAQDPATAPVPQPTRMDIKLIVTGTSAAVSAAVSALTSALDNSLELGDTSLPHAEGGTRPPSAETPAEYGTQHTFDTAGELTSTTITVSATLTITEGEAQKFLHRLVGAGRLVPAARVTGMVDYRIQGSPAVAALLDGGSITCGGDTTTVTPVIGAAPSVPTTVLRGGVAGFLLGVVTLGVFTLLGVADTSDASGNFVPGMIGLVILVALGMLALPLWRRWQGAL